MLFKRIILTFIAAMTLSACMNTTPVPENSITKQTLENGLSYAIHAGKDNSNQIQLRLFIASGSLSETDQQSGYAHLLEHMAFNGTKHFPKNKIIALFEKSGLTFGQDINAYTSFTETVYTLTIPTSDEKLLEETLLYLSDVLNNIEFDQAELDKEKGVVQNEYRARVPQEKPYYYAIFDDYIAGSHYHSRLPIGTLESVGNSTTESIMTFYKKWYRPDNAKLLIAGNVDSELTEQLIKKTFSTIKATKNKQQQSTPEAPKLTTESKAFSSKVVTFSQTDLFFEIDNIKIKSVEQLSQSIKMDMLANMLNYRLNVLNNQRDLPFSETSFNYFPVLNNKTFKAITVVYQEGNAAQSVKFIAQELARVTQHGFSQAEYELQLKALETQQAELENNHLNQNSAERANQVVHSWSTGDTLFTLTQEQAAYQKALSTITLSEINQLASTLINTPKKLTVAYPYGSISPNFLMIDKVFNKHLKQAISNSTIKIEKMILPIITKSTDITAIKSEKKYPQKNITQLTLNNGVDVILQPDNSVKNSISISFSAPGGIYSLNSKEVIANTLLLNSYINSGLAGLSPQTLQQKMINAKVELTPNITNSSHGFDITSINKPESLKLSFSLLYSALSEATIKPQVFTQEKQRLISNQQSFLGQPTTATQIKLLAELFPNSLYQKVITISELQAIQQSDVEALHKKFFGHVNGYKLTIVGDFDSSEMRALILKYIAPLHRGEQHQFSQQPQALIQQAVKFDEFTNPQNNAIVTLGVVTDNKNQGIKEIYQADLLRRLLTQTLNKEIREKLSLTYSPSVYIADQPPGHSFTEVFIQVVTKVEDAQKTQQVLSEIINNLIQKGITNEQFKDHQLGLTKGMLSNLHKSTDRQRFLHRDHLYGYELDSTVNAQEIVDSISVADMNLFIKTYLDPTKMMQMINRPKQ